MISLRRLLGATLVAAVTAAATPGQANDARALAQALEQADRGDHTQAAHLAAMGRDDVVAELAAWRRLLDGEGSFAEMRRMLDRRPDWPRRAQLRRQAERAMPPSTPAAEVLSFFGDRAPLTATGALRLAAAQQARGDAAAADATLSAAWTRLDMTQAEREAFQAAHPRLTGRLAAERLDDLLWRGETEQARALFPLVRADQRALAEARMGLRARANGVDGLIARVPASLSNDAGLAFERFVWRARGDRNAEAEQLLMTRTGSAAALGRPEFWAERRATFARRAFREGRVAEAYRMASAHHLQTGTEFADLEWLSGWIALQGLRDPNRAAGHFLRHYNDVVTPISRGRGGYWLGRAYEAAGDTDRARQWYAKGAEHPSSFYGQLAAEKIGRGVETELAGTGTLDWRRSRIAGSDTVRAIELLHRAGREGEVRSFVTALADTLTDPEDVRALGALAIDLGRPDGAVVAGKRAARNGLVLMDIYYPKVDVVMQGGAVEPAFALAIARQESEMNPLAVSPAGARGLMQLMPATAQKVSRDLGMPYALDRLTSDPSYNVRLGQTYLAEMMARFGGAPILAAAAYNAGPGRVDEWLGRLGDPRRGGVDPIDWIEHIPFTETRNYVHRVLEGKHVYRARLGVRAAQSFAAALTRPQG
jgi:soluble lytic murein transglycosylase